MTRALTADVATVTDGKRVPRRFSALIDVPDAAWPFVLTIGIEPDGSAVCYSLGVAETDRSTGSHVWVHDALTELPIFGLREWVQWAVAVAATQLETGQHPTQWPNPPGEGEDVDPNSVWWRFSQTVQVQSTRRRSATTPARLRRVATEYNAALVQERRDPTVAVADALGVSRSQAAKLVMQCRRTDPPLLPPLQRKKGAKP